MGLFNHKPLFCTICKKSITYKQKAKRRWNIEGYLCGDCWINEMQKQYVLKVEIKEQEKTNYVAISNELTKKIKPEKSTRSIKFDYYFNVFFLIFSPIWIIVGLSTENPISLIIGFSALVISIIQYPKRKKALDRLSENADRVSEHEESPLSVLKMRLAKGEITKEEFDKIKDDLKD